MECCELLAICRTCDPCLLHFFWEFLNLVFFSFAVVHCVSHLVYKYTNMDFTNPLLCGEWILLKRLGFYTCTLYWTKRIYWPKCGRYCVRIRREWWNDGFTSSQLVYDKGMNWALFYFIGSRQLRQGSELVRCGLPNEVKSLTVHGHMKQEVSWGCLHKLL